jgi:hypothetical protein
VEHVEDLMVVVHVRLRDSDINAGMCSQQFGA